MGERSTHLQGEFYGSQGLYMSLVKTSTMAADCCGVGQATVDKLTDDALLEIFDFYLNENPPRFGAGDEWHTLVHVCRRWRNIVFGSPHRLDLRLRCTEKRPVRAALDIWPVLPLEIEYYFRTWEMRDDIIAALEHHDRVRKIALGGVSNPVWEILVTALRMPFPELTSLRLFSDGRSVPVLPDSFLGGSAPRLRTLGLRGFSFPGVLNLPLSSASTSDLVDLNLYRLPHSGYISPASMVACLSSLNRLKSLEFGFESPRSRPDQPSPPPQTRVVLPALSHLWFEGMVDYSEDFLARIDTPVLNDLYMEFFMDLVFDIPHFKQFIDRAKGPNPSNAAELWFDPQSIRFHLDQPHGPIYLHVRCKRIDWQLDSMTRLCGQLSPFFSSIERFDLVWDGISAESEGKDDMESTQFLEIFQSFPAIRSLYVSRTLVPFISRALQELIGESATEVLPNLHDLFLEGFIRFGSIQEDIQPFIEARRLSGQPVAVYHWEGGESSVRN
ncbi:hypothetical protein BC826DRAFT_120769 [Russula brevipes]|nr:hypothetical protein BC826DRAFT_120769 [Russula brevipes]